MTKMEPRSPIEYSPNIDVSPSRKGARVAREFATRGRQARIDGPRQGAGRSLRRVPLRLLVTLRERIGLDQVGGLEEQFELAIELGIADAGLRPEVMVFMDAHVAFGRFLEFDAWRGGGDLVDVEAASLLAGQFPQPRAEIAGLRHVADHGLLTPEFFEGGNERLVVRIVERLEVLHAGIGARDVFAADAVDFVFGYRDRQQRLLGEVDAGRLELLVEGDVRTADHVGENHVGLGQLDLVDHRIELGAAERVIFLADDLALQHVLDVLARDLVRGARPDVVRADEEKRLRALLLGDPVQAGENLLGCFLTAVDDVLGLLETFLEGRIIEHAVVLLDDRQHRLARCRGPAAHDRRDLVVDKQLLRFFRKCRPVAGAVFLDELDLASEHAAGGVDLFDGELFGLDRTGFRNRHRAGGRVQDADGDFSIGNRETRGVDRSGCRTGSE